tara:strand:+ start:285 stop:527 length:243 start_codon:yes stop_codon:yes gene_type:complete
MDVDKKVLKHILMNFMDDLVENYFVFNQPLIKKDDNLNRGMGYGSGDKKLINFMFQVSKPSKKDIESFVNAHLLDVDKNG